MQTLDQVLNGATLALILSEEEASVYMENCSSCELIDNIGNNHLLDCRTANGARTVIYAPDNSPTYLVFHPIAKVIVLPITRVANCLIDQDVAA